MYSCSSTHRLVHEGLQGETLLLYTWKRNDNKRMYVKQEADESVQAFLSYLGTYGSCKQRTLYNDITEAQN
jgi:hypothetical protein